MCISLVGRPTQLTGSLFTWVSVANRAHSFSVRSVSRVHLHKSSHCSDTRCNELGKKPLSSSTNDRMVELLFRLGRGGQSLLECASCRQIRGILRCTEKLWNKTIFSRLKMLVSIIFGAFRFKNIHANAKQQNTYGYVPQA